MSWFRPSIKQLARTNKDLRELTDAELEEFLNKNEQTNPEVLACICSEILRRRINKGRWNP